MKAKPLVFFALSLLVACVFYALGVRNGKQQQAKMLNAELQMKEAQFRLIEALKIHSNLESNNVVMAQSELGMLILIQTREYQLKYGSPTKADRFAQPFDMAVKIADQVEARLVPLESAIKSIAPNATVTVIEQ